MLLMGHAIKENKHTKLISIYLNIVAFVGNTFAQDGLEMDGFGGGVDLGGVTRSTGDLDNDVGGQGKFSQLFFVIFFVLYSAIIRKLRNIISA